jgi:CubicO group peptidase (beta-lactamase class C family)
LRSSVATHLENNRFDRAADVVRRAHEDGAFPAAVVEVGTVERAVWRQSFGRLDYDAASPATRDDTIFELASLTKVIATTSVTMRLVDRGRIALADSVRRWMPEWRGKDRDMVTLRAFLTHSAGLTPTLPFYRDHTGRQEFQHAICSLPLEYEPDTQSIYSDLGFILLAFILEDVAQESFETLVGDFLKPITGSPILFKPPSTMRSSIAPTEFDAWRGRRLVGEVHDENGWALGGVAGHTGLFGTAEAVGDFARVMLRGIAEGDDRLARKETVQRFVTRAPEVPGSRALGWDTMLPTSSCGTKISPTSFGHTGFTGTSLWIDPERRLYVVFLTNRVNPTRENTKIQKVRPALHDAVIGAFG